MQVSPSLDTAAELCGPPGQHTLQLRSLVVPGRLAQIPLPKRMHPCPAKDWKWRPDGGTLAVPCKDPPQGGSCKKGILLIDARSCSVTRLDWLAGSARVPAEMHAIAGWAWTGHLLVMHWSPLNRRGPAHVIFTIYQGAVLVKSFHVNRALLNAKNFYKNRWDYSQFSPDGRLIAGLTPDELGIWVCTVATEQVVRIECRPGPPYGWFPPVWEPTSERCILGASHTAVSVVNPATGSCHRQHLSHRAFGTAWGSRGVVMCEDQTIFIYTVEPERDVLVLKRSLRSRRIWAACATPSWDGSCLAVRVFRAGRHELAFLCWDDGALHLPQVALSFDSILWAADGSAALMVGGATSCKVFRLP